MTLAFRQAGDREKPPVVLLHAIGASSAMWAPQIDALAPDHHVIAIDLPGHGESLVDSGIGGVPGFADHVIATIDALALPRFALAGVSLGSMVAQRVAARLSSRIDALILSNGIAYAPPPVRDLWTTRIAQAEAEGMAATVEPTLARWFTPDYLQARPAPVRDMARQIAATPLAGFVAAARGIAALDNRDVLPTITARTLVLAGEQDVASPPATVRGVADAIPDATFETLPAGHLMNLEIADAYSARLLAFLQ